jgi:hypothetical protein
MTEVYQFCGVGEATESHRKIVPLSAGLRESGSNGISLKFRDGKNVTDHILGNRKKACDLGFPRKRLPLGLYRTGAVFRPGRIKMLGPFTPGRN